MTQLVFIHGPGAGGCADSYENQLRRYTGSLAPHLPGHLDGTPCSSVERYTDWLRGWLHSQGHDRDLVLSGFTLGRLYRAAICAGLSRGSEGSGPDDHRDAAEEPTTRGPAISPRRCSGR